MAATAIYYVFRGLVSEVRTIVQNMPKRHLAGEHSLRRAIREFVTHLSPGKNHQRLGNRRIVPNAESQATRNPFAAANGSWHVELLLSVSSLIFTPCGFSNRTGTQWLPIDLSPGFFVSPPETSAICCCCKRLRFAMVHEIGNDGIRKIP